MQQFNEKLQNIKLNTNCKLITKLILLIRFEYSHIENEGGDRKCRNGDLKNENPASQ